MAESYDTRRALHGGGPHFPYILLSARCKMPRSSVKCDLSITYEHKTGDIKSSLDGCFLLAVMVNLPSPGEQETTHGRLPFRTFQIERQACAVPSLEIYPQYSHNPINN